MNIHCCLNLSMATLIQNMSDITSVSARWRVFARVEENICTGVELQTSGPGLSGLTRTENLSAAVKNKSSGGLKNISWQTFPESSNVATVWAGPQLLQTFIHADWQMLFLSHVTIKMWMCRALIPEVLTGHAKITANREKCSHFFVTWTSH